MFSHILTSVTLECSIPFCVHACILYVIQFHQTDNIVWCIRINGFNFVSLNYKIINATGLSEQVKTLQLPLHVKLWENYKSEQNTLTLQLLNLSNHILPLEHVLFSDDSSAFFGLVLCMSQINKHIVYFTAQPKTHWQR